MEDKQPTNQSVERLKAFDWFFLLFGKKEAIQRAVASPWSIIIGGILILSTEVARNYDLLPLNEGRGWVFSAFWWQLWASALTFSIIYFAFYFIPRLKNPPFVKQYAAFLGPFMMLAPIGWLDAVPTETLLGDPLMIAKVNFGLLVIIAVWRLLLITRITTVIGGVGWFKSFACALLAMSTLVFFRSLSSKFEIAGWTGRLELNPAEQFLSESYEWINRGAFLVAILALMLIFWPTKKERVEPEQFRFSRKGLPVFSLVSVLVAFGVWCAWAYPWQANPKLREARVNFEKSAKQRTKESEKEAPVKAVPVAEPKPVDDPKRSNY